MKKSTKNTLWGLGFILCAPVALVASALTSTDKKRLKKEQKRRKKNRELDWIDRIEDYHAFMDD